MADTSPEVCEKHPYLIPTQKEMENAPIFLIRTESGNVKFPPLNIYQSFEESCREYNVIGAGGKLSSGIINENLEYVLVKRSDTHQQDSFQLGQIMFEKVDTLSSQTLSPISGGLNKLINISNMPGFTMPMSARSIKWQS